MQALGAAAVGLLVAASIVVGFRLVALHRRSGGAPELLLGLMLLLSVGAGYPLLIAASRVGPDWVRPVFIVSTLCVNVGFAMLFAFTWRVFRRDAAWGGALAGAGMLALLANAAFRCWDAATGAHVRIAGEVVRESGFQGAPVLLGYLWTAWESLRYHGLMRRRLALGLADPAVCNRFLLWGLMALFVASGVVLNGVALWKQIDILSTPWVLLASSFTGSAQTILLLLAFLPPSSYLAWVRSRARVMEA
jgi:hypothetical protein